MVTALDFVGAVQLMSVEIDAACEQHRPHQDHYKADAGHIMGRCMNEMKQIGKHRAPLSPESVMRSPYTSCIGVSLRGMSEPVTLFAEAIPIWDTRGLSPRISPFRNTKKPPGNRAASSLGRIVPTEAKPSELSGCIVRLAQTGVKAKT